MARSPGPSDCGLSGSQEAGGMPPEMQGPLFPRLGDVLAATEEYLRPLLPLLPGYETRSLCQEVSPA